MSAGSMSAGNKTVAGNLIRPVMPELDTVRGIAVLLVVLFHGLYFAYGLAGLSFLPRLLVASTAPGWVGVNLFFVLSGFLITGILLDTRERPDYFRRFYIRRALRILPLYYGVLLLLAVLSHFGWMDRHVGWPFLALSFIYLSNVCGLFGVPLQYGVLWSLAVEEHFYLLWPAAVRKLSRRAVICAAGAVCLACAGLRLLYALRGYDMGPGYTWLVADGLAMGALLAALARGPGDQRLATKRVAAGALALGGGMLALGAPFGIFLAGHVLGSTLRETALDLLCLGVISAALLLGTSPWKALVNRPVLQFLGRISYGIYLIHMLVFEASDHLLARLAPGLSSPQGHFGLIMIHFCTGMVLTVALASLSRRYFEQPFLRLKSRFENKASEPAPAPKAASGDLQAV
ncbi:MAG TPA: acyltransferase [Terriglobales bacterium]|nr:acyltransferase [Terriglobales bacterium]